MDKRTTPGLDQGRGITDINLTDDEPRLEDYEHDITCQVVADFAEAALYGRGPQREAALVDGLRPDVESARRAYRERAAARCTCRSCPKPSAPGRKSCVEHLAKNNARAHASHERAEQRSAK